MPLSSPPAAPQRGDRTTFAQRVDAFITWLIGFVSELNIFSANLNSIAAGGAYAIPYLYRASSDPANGSTMILAGQQSTSTTLYIDEYAFGNVMVSQIIDTFDDSTSTIKGQIKIQKVGDTSKFLLMNVTGMASTPPYTYRTITVSPVGGSGANPFAPGDLVMLFFQRTGDKGDAGIASCLKVSDRKSATEGGAASAGWNTRTLNTIDANTITGASLASNTVTLPAGTFDVFGRAPATQNIHKAALYNVTDSVYALIGSNAQSSSSGASTDSIVIGRITITSPKTFQLRHYVNSTSGSGTHFGFTSGSGQIDVYSELQFLKVA